MEIRRKASPSHYNSTGDLRKLGNPRRTSSLPISDDEHPQGATVVEAFSHHSPKWEKQSKGFLASIAFLVFLTVMTSGNARRPRLRGGKAPLSSVSYDGHQYSFGGAKRPGYFYPKDAILSSNEFLFAAVTDQDKASRDPSASLEKPRFRAILLPGILKRDKQTGMYTIEFRKEREIITKHNEAGRGAEYSDLQLFDNRLLTFDDRTGTVVEILNADDGMSSTVSPRFVFTEGYGHSDKGMKWEWATVKDGELVMGSIGKELTNKDLTFKSQAGMWVVAMNTMGQTRRIDWTEEYNFVRMQLFADLPGYVVHEAVHWSQHLNKWVFLPRRISQQPYSPRTDEKLGSNKVLLVDEGFTMSTTVEVNFETYKEEDGGLHGFSAFSFVPNTKDRHVLAIRSVEDGCYTDNFDDCSFRTYFCVFDIVTGELLMDEVLYDAPLKFEGLEFVDMYAAPPPSIKEYE
mmetsp:Transcript_16070/g.39356  ORF Transcript_16070/g.39356 Transcript_16070/m.39356 type:complete len:460 (-) Transcript_16070:43-1422(-)